MKKIFLFIILAAFVMSTLAQETVIFHEGFEGGVKPTGWNQEKILGLGGSPTGPAVNWQYLDGGYFDYPDHAYQGNYNAMFQLESYLGETTRLITPPLDLSDVLKPELRFAHAQQTWFFNDLEYNDMLKIYYKRGLDSSWVLLESYENAVEDWITRSILLPDSSLSSTYYIAFEGITGFGYGTCIDTVRVMETGIISKYVKNYTIQQASTDFIPTNTTNNPILKIVFDVEGNDRSLYLDSLKVSSLNDDDNNLLNNGVKLYATDDSTFKDPVLISSGVNFTNGIASFKNINYDLPRGITTVWITYDIAPAINHNIHNNIVDAKIKAENMYINGSAFPFADKSPEGERLLKEAIINDTFESDLGWLFNGSFERDIPQGLGDIFPGNPDPENAYNGSYIIGTDLTSDGAYANSLTNRKDSAISPTIDCFYYNDVQLYFIRWLNIEFFDNCYIDISNDNSSSWTQLWKNSGSIIENSWSTLTYDLSQADFKEDVNIRFALGTTSGGNQYTGWNIDNFILIGDFISKDVGITGFTLPETGCGHTASDNISVYIENYAGEATPNSIPLRYSIDGSEDYIVDAYSSSISIGDSAFFTFSVGADLSTSGFHTIKVETLLSGDEISNNNSKSINIFSYPTLSIPYFQNFESNNGYFLPGGTNSTWEYGEPSAIIIDDAASGINAWVTSLTGSYLNNDSSFLESPCFNFNGSDSIVFEYKCKGLSEDQTDGLTLLYSLNEGDTWNVIPDDNNFYWNWYNETLISELELPGIDTTNGEWLTLRQLLPPTVSNQSSVKFRFAFESNGSFKFEGYGIDDIRIYETPYDVGVSTIAYPYTKCELSDTTHVKVYVGNYGIIDVLAGTKIPLSLNFESEITYDTIELASDLAVNDSVLFTFNSTVDMSYADDFDFIINTKLESNTYFYNDTVSNDTTYSTISVTGMPSYNPFPELIGVNPVDTFIVAGSGFVSYDWMRPVLADTTTLTTDTLAAKNEGWYEVTVTNGVGCTAIDSVEVVNSDVNLAMDSLYTILADSCERNKLTELSVHYINNSITPLVINDTILLAYQINDNEIVLDSMFLTVGIALGDTAWFTYSDSVDFKTPGEYTLKVFTNIGRDLNHIDDTITKTFNTWGYIDVELAYDTIYSSQADTLELTATTGYDTYSWNTGSDNDTIIPTNTSYYYKIIVSDDNICSVDSDSTYIETHDFGITAINNPVDICEDVASATENLNIEITNYSDNMYGSAESVDVFYNFDNSGWTATSTLLSGGLAASGTINLTIDNIDTRLAGVHNLKMYTSSNIDANHTNDTINYTFNTWLLPDVDLMYDTIFTRISDTIILVAQSGFASYLWDDASTNDSLVIDNNLTHKYKVDVTDINGCGIDSDSTYVFTYNLGVTSLVAPLSECEHSSNENVIVSVKNYGNDIISSGTIIPVAYILNEGIPVTEDYTLTSDLNPSGSVNITFTQKTDLSSVNSYNFKLYSSFEFDAYRQNDTLIDVIKTFGLPNTNLGSDIYTTQPDTVILIAEPGFSGYYWNEGTNNDTLIVTYPASKLYEITVNDINGCLATDSLNIFTYDVGIFSINTPTSNCEFNSAEVLNVSVLNNSRDTLLTDETINLSYSLNGGSAVNEVFTLTSDLLPDSTADYSFISTLDLTLASNHDIKVTSLKTIDVNDINDTLSVNINEVGYPSFSLGDDIYTTDPDGTILTAPDGYDSYLWQDGSVSTNFTVTYLASAQYAVTVTDEYECEGSDILELFTYDIAASELITPISQCELTSTETVSIDVINNSLDTLLFGETINVSYILNSETTVNESFNLSTDSLKPTEIVNYTFTQTANLSANQVHELELFAELANIDVKTDDAITRNVDYQKPELNLGSDVTEGESQHDIKAGAGYTNYKWFDGTESSIDSTYTVDINDQSSSHLYWVEVTNSDGCTDEDTIQVIFTTTPDLAVTAMFTPESGCWIDGAEYPVHIEITNSGVVNLNPGNNFIVGYNINGGTDVTETFNLTTAMNTNDTREYTFPTEIPFASAKIYLFKPFVKYSEDGNVSNDTLTTGTIVEITAPEVLLGVNDTINTYNETHKITPSEAYSTYLWSDGSDGSELIVTETGLYSVTITDEYDCSGEGSIYINFLTDIDNLIQGDGYKLTYFPNPVSEQLMIQFENKKSKDVIIEIVSSNGQVVYINKISNVENSTEKIDVTPFSNGVYFIRFNIDDEFYIRKIIIQ